MSNKIFTEKEIKVLSKNKYVENVTNKGITYTDEFKRTFIAKNEKGKLPRVIFEECGFDTEILGMQRIHSCGKRWRNGYRNKGIDGLKDTRKGNSGRPLERNLSDEEKIDRLKLQNKLLKAENELLKKVDLLERRLRKGK